MSFVDLMASDVWSDSDINNRVQALIRSRFSAEDELKAARLARKPDSTVDEQAFVADVDGWIADCIQQGRDARADMALLAQVFPMEEAARRLARPEVDPSDDEHYTQDQAERAAAQAVLDGASTEETALYEQRNPREEEVGGEA